MKKILTIAGLILIIYMATDKFTFEKDSNSQYPINPDARAMVEQAIDELLPNKILDLVWRDYFYLFETPVVIDAANLLGTWSMAASGGSFSGTRNQVILHTGGTANNYAVMTKDIENQDFINFNKQQRLRTTFYLDFNTNILSYITRGTGDNYYGFKIEDGNLYGTLKSDGGTEQNVLLSAISGDEYYTVEALFDPAFGVTFRLLKPFRNTLTSTDTQRFEEVGRLSTQAPVSVIGETTLFYVYAKNKTTSTEKQLAISYMEYIQKR